MPIPDFTMEDLDIVLTKLDSDDTESVSIAYVTNYWNSNNKNLIKYIADEVKQVNFVEKLTEENK